MKYYLDTCIWRDHYENRKGPNGRPLGKYATKLITKIIKNKEEIIFSEHILQELSKAYSNREIEELFQILIQLNILKLIQINKKDINEAIKTAKEKNTSKADALHAILARNNNATLVTQNIKDYEKLEINVKRPEELI